MEDELIIAAIILIFLSFFAGLFAFFWLFFIAARLRRHEAKLSELDKKLEAFSLLAQGGTGQNVQAAAAAMQGAATAMQGTPAQQGVPAQQGTVAQQVAAAQQGVPAQPSQTVAGSPAQNVLQPAQTQGAPAAAQVGASPGDAGNVPGGTGTAPGGAPGTAAPRPMPAWMRPKDGPAVAAAVAASGAGSQSSGANADEVIGVGDTVPPGASKPSAPAKPQSLETFFLGNIFNKLGALAIIIGMIIFVGIAAPLLTPELKIAAAYALGLAFISGGAFIHKRMVGMGEVLMGTGFAVMFIITYCSCSIFPVFSPNTALFVSCILLAAIYAVSVGMKRMSMLVLAMVGGYANVLFIDFSPSNEFMMVYLILLNLLVLMGAYRCKAWVYLTTINLFCTLTFFATQVAWSRCGRIAHAFFHDAFSSWFPEDNLEGEALFIGTAIVLWGMYAVYDMLRSKEDLVAFSSESPLCYMNAFLLTVFSVVVFHTNTIGLGLFLWVVSLGYAAFTYYHYKHSNYVINPYFNLTLLTHMAGTFFALGTCWRVPALGVESLVLAYLASRFRYANIPAWSVVYMLTSAAAALYAEPNAVYGGGWKEGLTHLDIFLCGAPVVLGFLASYVMRTEDKRYDAHADSLSLTALTMLYAGVFIELHSYMVIKSYIGREVEGMYYYMLVSLAFTAQCLWMGKYRRFFKIAGLIAFFITLPVLVVCSFLESGKFVPLLNVRTLCFALAIASTLILSLKDTTVFFKTVAVFLGFCYVNSEALNLAAICNFESITTIFWILYAGAIILPGMFRHQKYLTYSGIFLVCLSCAKILLYDISELPGIYKLIIFMVMGFTL
nr:DUF2339 domain-containing protein [bacterium]